MVRIVVLIVIAWSAVARADGPELPRGRWTASQDRVETCLKILEGHQLELAFQGPEDREPIRVEAEYQVSAMKMGEFHVDAPVKRVVQKQLTRCRKSWADFDLPSTNQLGRVMRAGDRLRLTLRFSCQSGHETVQLCLHDAQVVCRTLVDDTSSCKEGSPVDGSPINRPPK